MASTTNGPKAHDTPAAVFGEERWSAAMRTADEYTVIVKPRPDGGYMGTSFEIPTVFARGCTRNECNSSTTQALAIAVATILEAGGKPPASSNPRTDVCCLPANANHEEDTQQEN